MKLTCKECNIRFKNANLHQQRIRAGDQTAASHLEVSITSEFITVMYMYVAKDKDGIPTVSKPMKVLVFNKDEIVEVECENGVSAEPCQA